MSESPPAIREQAAQIIEQRGWCRGRYGYMGGECCIVGAINMAAKMNENDARDVRDMVKRELKLPPDMPLFVWNDHFMRTQADVLHALRGGR